MRNEGLHIADQLEALADQGEGSSWELLLVDNGSTDGSALIASSWRERLPSLRVINAPQARNQAEARNIGVSSARGELLLHADGDDVVGPNWMRSLVHALHDFDLAGGPIEVARLNPPGSFGWRPACQPPLPVQGDFLPYASTSNLGIRRTAFDRLGGFDARLRRGADVDLSWRAQLEGLSLGEAADALVHRRLRATAAGLFWQQFGYGEAGAHLYARFRRYGAPRPALTDALHEWAFLLARCHRLHDPTFRREWAVVAGRRTGRLAGSLRARSLYL